MGKNNEIWKSVLVNSKKTNLPLIVSSSGLYGIKKPKGEVEVRVKKIKNGNVRHKIRVGKTAYSLSLAKIVATAFVKKSNAKQSMIIHKDYDYTNNSASNLKWVTPKEHRAHSNKSPNTLLARKKKAFTKSVHNRVLNEKSVVELKKMIWDPKRNLSYAQLAKKFGVSQMQIYRIKSGEIWFHVKVENEPLNARYEENLKNIAYQQKNKLLNKKDIKKKDKDVKGLKDKKKKDKKRKKLKKKKH